MASTGSLEPAPAERLFADRNVGLFVAFRVLFNARFYYPVFMILFLDFGITLEQLGLLNAIWAATIVLLEVPSGALADLLGRRRLLVAAAGLMVVEMLLLCLVPVPSPWVFPALVLNRIVSGAAEAFASGADEALAYDSLQAAGQTQLWPRVLERLMQFGAGAAIIGMAAGSLLYDPGPLNALATACGFSTSLTPADTFRLPVWLTLCSAIAAVGVCLAMREPARTSEPAAGILAPFRQTLATGGWILGQPLVLVVILGGVVFDQPIRQLLVVSSEIFRQIQIPDPALGFVNAGSAAVGLLVASPLRRLVMQASPRRSFLFLAVMTFVGLIGTAAFIPWWGVGFFFMMTMALRMLMFLQSHYLNQLTDSAQRATVLSFRGLAVNVSYGLMSLAFAGAVAGAEASGIGGGEETTMPAFRFVVGLLPWYFLVCSIGFAAWVRLAVRDRAVLTRQGGFGEQPGQ